MKPEPQSTPPRWPTEGVEAKRVTEAGCDQIREYYQPEHGKLPAPHELSSRSSWDQALADTQGPMMPGMPREPGAPGRGVHVPFPARRGAMPEPTRKLPVKPGNGGFENIWACKGKK